MKVAFIVHRFPCLSETFILNQITGLVDRGHEVDIYAKYAENNQVIHADIQKYNLLERTFYYDIIYQTMPANKFWRLIKGIGLMIANFHKGPGPLLKSLNIFKFGAEAASLTLLYKTVTFLDQGIDQYDIIHCHFGPNGTLGALLKDVGAIKGKVITTFHGFDLSNYIRNKKDNVYAHLFEVGDIFLPISDRWKNELIGLGCKGQKIAVHRMGVDTSRFSFSPRQPESNGKVRLLTVARLVEKKGVIYGIQAVAKALNKYPQIEYKIVGDGPLQPELKRLINQLNINDKVMLLGWKNQEEIVELMKKAHILLAPSVVDKDGGQEGIPVVLMEALAQGLPVLSTWHSGIPELIQDGQSGFLVPERDVNALTEKLEYLIEHQELWPKMGRVGRDYIEQYYNINKLNDQLVTIYQQLFKGINSISLLIILTIFLF